MASNRPDPQNQADDQVAAPGGRRTRKKCRAKYVCNGKYKREKMELGSRVYGRVYKAEVVDKPGTFVALKRPMNDTDGANPNGDDADSCMDDEETIEGIFSTTLREIDALQKLSECDNIVGFKVVEEDYCKKHNKWTLYLVFDFYDTDLRRFIKSNSGSPFPPELIKVLMFQILRGLAFMDSPGIWHRDLKPENITLTRSPEIVLGAKYYSPYIDVWAAGCILAELYRGKSVFYKVQTAISQLFQTLRLLGTPPEGLVAEYAHWNPQFPKMKFDINYLRSVVPGIDNQRLDLLMKMWNYDPEKRISAKRALAHPYFDEVRTLLDDF